jgi:hypothetical protein
MLWSRASAARIMRSAAFSIWFLLFLCVCVSGVQLEVNNNTAKNSTGNNESVLLSIFHNVPNRKPSSSECKRGQVWSKVAKRCIIPLNGNDSFYTLPHIFASIFYLVRGEFKSVYQQIL